MSQHASIEFAKGHGTGNDFVLLADDDGKLDLTVERVQRIADRRFGIGADGVIRVTRGRHVAEADASMADAWFMDYRNADGSIAEMCGNGIRVFAQYLYATGRVSGENVAIGTRAGLLTVTKDGDIYHVDMGKAHLLSEHVVINANNLAWDGIGVAMPNPHAIATVNDVSEAGALMEAPQVTPAAIYPHGVNVEFIANVGPNHIAMRVFERGVGETLSCGTGVCAAAYAARRQASQTGYTKWRVDVPGGTLFVQQDDDDSMVLSGPAVIVATGTLNENLWQ